MIARIRTVALAALAVILPAQLARAQGDLLVAPTRLVFNGVGANEVVVSNSGTKPATYRISLALRRMDEKGQINSIEENQATPAEAAALAMISYAPRKITLDSRQSQTIRIGVRPPADLPPGEYRAHLLFRAVPDAAEPVPAAAAAPASEGMSIQLTPIYGVAIPLIVRTGDLAAAGSVTSATLDKQHGENGIAVELARSGNASFYGTIELMVPGKTAPALTMKGIAVYPEIERRTLFIPLDSAMLASARSGMTVRFTGADPAGKQVVSQVPVRWTQATR